MSTTTPGPSRPDPTQPIMVGPAGATARPAAPVPPAPPPAPRRHRRTWIIVGVTVLAVAATGLGGWAVLRPYLGAPTNPTTSSTPTGSASPTPTQSTPPPSAGALIVPYDLSPYDGWPLGVWSGVAVFGGGSPGSDVLSGVDATTGAVLWTVQTTPDGSPFQVYKQAFAASGGTLAVQVGTAPYQDDYWSSGSAPECPGRMTVMLVDLRTGAVTPFRSWDPVCTPSENGLTVQSPRLTTYADSIVVLTDETDAVPRIDAAEPLTHRTLTTTTAYRTTDPTQPLWQVAGSLKTGAGSGGSPDSAVWGGGGPLLLDRWVAAASGVYVDLYTGAPTTLAYNSPVTTGQAGRFVAPYGGRLFTLHWDQYPTKPGSISWWDSPTAAEPVWTYVEPVGSARYGSAAGPWACASDDLGIDVVGSDPTPGGTVTVTSVDLTTGKPLWSLDYGWDDGGVSCALASRADQEVLALGIGSVVRFLDAATHREIAPAVTLSPLPQALPQLSWFWSLYACGQAEVCALKEDQLTTLSYSAGTATIEAVRPLNLVHPDEMHPLMADAGHVVYVSTKEHILIVMS